MQQELFHLASSYMDKNSNKRRDKNILEVNETGNFDGFVYVSTFPLHFIIIMKKENRCRVCMESVSIQL